MIDSLHCEFVDTIKSFPLIEYLVLLASLSSMLICLCVCMLHKFKLLLLKDFLTYIEYSHFLNFLIHYSCGVGGVVYLGFTQQDWVHEVGRP